MNEHCSLSLVETHFSLEEFMLRMQVLVKGRGQMDICEVLVGDRLQSIAADGSLFFDEVYFFGHRNSLALGQFVSLWVHVPNHPAAVIKMSPR